ncbi:MAG: nicotinate-nucleotide--dimethylbenzimidazole phosphoribosyltransferase, partial [Phenylobacterium sp.]|uniref:nicotinate-nucleotide--dimethylbenzimidazole phosphoribosyltransferase n=1 Tax=Phenylobacterium sp. TaxID=1871053 RepID=UPI00273589E5
MSALPHVAWVDRALEPELRALVDGRAKPPGSLGRIESLAIQLGLIAGHARPRADRALLLVFAGDHGFAAAGASSYPPQVTEAMVRLLLAGGATANAFARAVGSELRVVDAGVAADLAPHPLLIEAKVRKGTRDASREPALTAVEVDAALASGARIAREATAEGYDLLAIGEMGIGNSAAAALLLHRLGPAPLADCIGAGAGQDAAGLSRKAALLERAAARAPASTDPRDALAQFGGCEIAMMAGAILGAAASRRPVLVDGFIAG